MPSSAAFLDLHPGELSRFEHANVSQKWTGDLGEWYTTPMREMVRQADELAWPFAWSDQ